MLIKQSRVHGRGYGRSDSAGNVLVVVVVWVVGGGGALEMCYFDQCFWCTGMVIVVICEMIVCYIL